MTESVLPWKRDDDCFSESNHVFRQQEFPAWIDNKDYISYQSPTSTYLGGLSKDPEKVPVTDIFPSTLQKIDTEPILAEEPSSNGEELGHTNRAFDDDETGESGLEMNSIRNEQNVGNDSATSDLTYL